MLPKVSEHRREILISIGALAVLSPPAAAFAAVGYGGHELYEWYHSKDDDPANDDTGNGTEDAER
jgi:hypothetical protein